MHTTLLRPKLVFLLILMIVVSACEAITTTHGRLIEPAELDRLELGATTQAETIAILGPPSFEGALIPVGSIITIKKWQNVLAARH